ncbi:S49 family peptidase, partial [Aeromonas salmonicida]|uniref:S49 family peptidase n=1 Tax=Aeromonas salmonicida TaxID=645 RepID=UPI003D319CBC
VYKRQVHGYGLAASQLQRLRDKGIKLTVAIDKVAASGGYMMACVADQILAAPLSTVGSRLLYTSYAARDPQAG